MSWLDTLTGILFVGHSLFGETNPDMLSDLLPDTQVEAQIINGAPLKYNWTNADQAATNGREVLPAGATNVVILTEATPLAEHLQWSQPADYAGRFYDLAIASNPTSRVFLQQTWPELTDPKPDAGEIANWRAEIDRDLPRWQGIVDTVNAARTTDSPEMALLPAGQAMARLSDEIDRGTVPGITAIDQLFADAIHPNDLGFYFLTMLQYGVVTGDTPVGLPGRLRDRWGSSFDPPAPDLAARLQNIAWDIVQVQALPPVPTSEPRPATPQSRPPTGTVPATAAAGAPVSAAPAPALSPPTQPLGPVPLAIGLAGVNDWGVQQPFLDVMKTARPWIGHLPGQWGGASHEDLQQAGYLDANGWVIEKPPELTAISALILTDLPPEARSLAGRYRLRFEGNGIIEVTGRATNVRYGKGEVQFDFTPGSGSVDIRIQRTDRARKGDYIRNITVVHLDHAQAFDAGAIFNTLWLDHLQGFEALRFMDWMQTNDSDQVNWADRPKPGDYTYARTGVPVEVMLELANRTGADPWFNIPHQASDDYVRRFAELVRERLWIEQKAYVEYSNEVWNWQFLQAGWADAAAKARWGQDDAWIEFYGARAAEIAQIWSGIYGPEAKTRLVNVIATQTGWLGLEQRLLLAPLWVAEKPGRKPPAAYFDAYAVTGYFGSFLGREKHVPLVKEWIADSNLQAATDADRLRLRDDQRAAYIAGHRFDAATLQAGADLADGLVNGETSDTVQYVTQTLFPYHAEIARSHGLDLIMYEGGSHVVGLGAMVDDPELTEFLIHLNYSQEMGALYSQLIEGWHAVGGQLFNAYVDVYHPTKWGSWGALRYLSDDNPRWQALSRFR